MIEFAIEALDRREWPRTEAEMRVARASRFAAQVLARDLIAVGRENQVEIIANSSPRLCPMVISKLPLRDPEQNRSGLYDDTPSQL